MKQSINLLQGRPWLLLAVLFAWLLPQKAAAQTYVDKKENYSVSLGGTNIIYFTAPAYDMDGADCWVKAGYLFVTVDGDSKKTLVLAWQPDRDIDNSKTSLNCYFRTLSDGFFDITLGNSRSVERVDSWNSKTLSLVRNSDGVTFDFAAEWVLPYNLLGKTLTFSWEVLRDGNGRKEEYVSGLKTVTIKVPAAASKLTPVVSAPMMNPNNPGKIELPWFIASDNVTKAYYEYYDANGKYQKVNIENVNSGTITLDATVPHRKFRVICNYKEKGDKGEYDIEGVASSVQNLTMIHAPAGLSVRPLNDQKGKIEVKWNVPYLDAPDLTPTDFFEIQRSLTGKEEDFETIFEQFYAKTEKKSSYTYIDSTLIEAIEASMLKNGGTLDNVTYRVRRTIAKDWGWGADNNCATSATCVLDELHLLRISNYTAKWENEQAYTVRVSWDYANEIGGVWDDRAKMILHITSKNRDGGVVEDKTIELNNTDRAKRYTIVNLFRSCVTYDIEMYVDKNESPLNKLDELTDYFFPIRTADDWVAFRDKVKAAEGKEDVNARLYADISLNSKDNIVGYSGNYPYRGVFDGNGHTITLDISDDANNTALFSHVANARFRSLHTAGTVTSSAKFTGGLIGHVDEGSTVNIENCRSSMTINSSVNGDATNGGFIGAVEDNCNIIIRTSEFDGSFTGDNCHSNGGFVGWTNGGSYVIIDNCLFNPDRITTKTDNCETWTRNSKNITLTLSNSYAVSEYSPFIVIRNATDWHKFAVMINDAVNQYDVNAVLDADIEVSEHVGVTEGATFRGTFDGNGHTLTFNKEWKPATEERFIAPFRHANNATIRNLHVAGTIESNWMYPAGLVAQVKDGTVTIENCTSSVTLQGNMNGEGTLAGFVGRVSNSNVTIRNSKFDGSFKGANCTGNGGFISWVDEKSTATIDSCLFAPTEISTKYDKCQTWARQDSRGTVTVTDCHATREYRVFPITSTADWTTFVQMVEDAKNEYWVDAILMNDITVTSYAGGGNAACYRGTFDGNGHTLNVNIDRTGADNGAAAPFAYVGDATIKNLHVTGTVKGGIHSAGLIGCRVGTPTITIDRVWVSTEVTASTSTHAAGVLGHAGAADVYMTDVRFDGKVTTNGPTNTSYAGSFIGWGGEGGWTFHRVYNASANGDFTAWRIWFCVDSSSGSAEAWGSNSNSSLTITATTWGDWGTTYFNKSDGTDVVNLMNGEKADSWTLDGGKAVPVLTTAGEITEASLASNFPLGWKLEGGKLMPEISVVTVDPAEVEKLKKIFKDWTVVGETIVPPTTTYDYNYATFNKPELPNFYHVSNGKIDKTLVTTTRQSSVLLAWNTDGNPIDYFTVKRRVKGEGDDAWKEIATNIDQMSYEDTSVSPLAVYEYKVIAVNQCEGRDSTETEVKVGESKHTGRVEGYVRFKDGTGVPDVKVDAIIADSTVTYAYTDESGHFVVDELSYQGGTSVTYKISPVGKSIKLEVEDYNVTFNATSNNETLQEFIVTNGMRFSGYVMFDGTSIPVKGVNFMVNGKKIHNAKGDLVETDYDGSFSFRVMEGDNSIQAVMENHKFTNDGWYKNSDKQSFKDDVAGIYFYDATKVKLTGRVVGGNDQGLLPLGNNLSKNNLGDSLTMVLTLEGDNTSWLVYDNLNPNLTKRDTTYVHPRGNGHKTQVTTERKRMEMLPDPVTGEYEVELPPVRWKVQQVYCKGYPTLFQEGQVSEVIDLTKCLVSKDTTYVGKYKDVDTVTVTDPKLSYHAIYNRIYRNPIEITYKQIGYDDFDYFGDKTYIASELTGKQTAIPLAYKNPLDTTQALYTFTCPVFSLERKYRIRVQVAETYPYNNDLLSGKVDYVKVGGGVATIHNGLKNGAPSDTLHLDANGQAIFTVQADQTTQLLSGLSALKTISFSVAQDGNYYESAPLYGYVLNMFPIGQSQDVMSEGVPVLYDILRDPPGGYSTNTLAKGTTLNFTYMMNLSLTAGLFFHYKYGEKLQVLSASVAAPQGVGTAVGPLSLSDNMDGNIDMLMYNANGSKAFSHTMVVGNNISTSGDPSMVGADADLYIGSVQNVVVTPMSTIRAVTDSMFNDIKARMGKDSVASEAGKYVQYGTVLKIADGEVIGKDGKTVKYHLIRDVALGYGPKLNSQFIYSQKQLLNQIIPAKSKEILDLMYIGTKADAQTIANNTQKPVYLSLRERTDKNFAVVNKKLYDREYNDSIDTAQDGINYLVVLPKGKKRSDFTDEVTEKYQVIKAWLEMISQNEGEKLQTRDLLANYDVGGAAGVNYSETFDASYTNSFTQHFPIATEVDYFDKGAGFSNGMSALALATTIVGSVALSMAEMKAWSLPDVTGVHMNIDDGTASSVSFGGKVFQWSLFPVVSYTTIGTDSEAKSYNRTESFTIATDPNSHLNVDVYRGAYSTAKQDSVSIANVFTNGNFNKMYDDVRRQVQKSVKSTDILGPRGFIFRTRGGSTQNPWEDQRVTKVYDPGTVLDARTLKIVNPKIRLDKQSVSGVSVNDAAKFMIFLSNESEKPEATDGLTVLQVFAPDQLNPLGAKISINGQPLTTAGITITVVPGIETALTMEVRAGEGFDFEGLTVGVMSPTDAEHTTALTSFDVHFLREAGAVTIATPGDKWVLNTNAQKDSERGWYIPVTINGFDRHQHNFDHIEFQYKESQRGDDSWTNLCSFYADSTLMASANGVRKLMPENGNITTEFYGEGWVIEKQYDLRAVVFCRNGNDFLTTSSKVISGIKDTRRPQLFGTPEPKSGLLTVGDDMIFNFSEDIEYNYLSAITNFEVKGEVNNDNLSEMVSVQFDGSTASVESEAKRNFSNKNLTIDMMVKPAETGREMPLFSHGTNGQKLQLWLTSDFKLKAVVNDQTFESNAAIGKNSFNQVAMVLNQTDSVLTFYNGGLDIGRNKLTAMYTGSGTLIFGRTNESDRSQSQYYEGRMMEARLWYSAMNSGQIGTTYGNRRLTGYEKDLVDYYPMDEGSGDMVADHTQGANAKLIGASWAIPRGLSLHLEKEDKGVLLNQNALNRSSEHDYTLMFWFKTDADGRGALLSNGRGVKEDIGAVNQFHIGFEADKLMYRSNGFVTEVPGDWSDGNWHHFAMTVNRARNVANIYVDKEVRTNFEPDTLGGISGGYPLIGATRYDKLKENGDVEVVDGTDAMKGNIDELMFFAQALPEQLIKTYATKSPNGDEAGLMTYLAFDRQERQKDNSIELVPYAYSKKIYLDDKGQPRYQLDPMTKQPTSTLVRDFLFVESADSVMKRFDAATAAPVKPYEEVKNLKFSFIGRDNQLLVELDENAARLNHRNIYVTVRDIEDKNGNTMASPQTACYYVTNSSLQWVVNRLDAIVKYGSGESCQLTFYNNGSQNHTYKIENCPRWLTLSKTTDVLGPQALDYVYATVSKDLSIGTYNEILYLTDEEGITEPFYLNLTVEGEQPDWAQNVNSDLLKNSMNIIGQVYLYNELDTDARDIVGAFDDEGVCHGFSNISNDAQTGELYLTVFDNQSSGRKLSFRLWQYSTGREIVLTPKDTIKFEKSAILGTDKPVRFDGDDAFMQNFSLKAGWNWVSFNVASNELSDVNTLLRRVQWSQGDILTDMNSDLTMTYEAEQKQWIATDNADNVVISPKQSYAIRVKEACTFPIGGSVIKDEEARTIKMKKGWNAIGYTPAVNLPLETALSDYYDQAVPGDVIKSHTEFAYYTKSGNVGRWRGSLQYMKPGEGYMMLCNADSAQFTYPYIDMNSYISADWVATSRGEATAVRSRSTMSVSAVVEGFDVEEGDKLIAYANGEECGSVMVKTALGTAALHGEEFATVNYLSIAGSSQKKIWFAIERDGEIVASTNEILTYHANDVVGSPERPTTINFEKVDDGDDLWYTISGIKLQRKPTKKGLYIFNGKKIVLK